MVFPHLSSLVHKTKPFKVKNSFQWQASSTELSLAENICVSPPKDPSVQREAQGLLSEFFSLFIS